MGRVTFTIPGLYWHELGGREEQGRESSGKIPKIHLVFMRVVVNPSPPTCSEKDPKRFLAGLQGWEWEW